MIQSKTYFEEYYRKHKSLWAKENREKGGKYVK